MLNWHRAYLSSGQAQPVCRGLCLSDTKYEWLAKQANGLTRGPITDLCYEINGSNVAGITEEMNRHWFVLVDAVMPWKTGELSAAFCNRRDPRVEQSDKALVSVWMLLGKRVYCVSYDSDHTPRILVTRHLKNILSAPLAGYWY
jgi:hypothetical protein